MEHFYKTINSENWFNYEDLYKLVVDRFPSDSHFVEVGVWKGQSACFMAVEIINSNKNIKFDCVDTWEFVESSSEIKEGQFENLFQIFQNNIEPVKDHINIVRSISWDGAKLYDDNSLDFVFIDAGHDYESVKKDLESWYPKVKEGGLIAGHDYHYNCGVYPAVNEFFGKDKIKQMNACWLFEKKKIDKPAEIIKMTHDAGFFSVCNINLRTVIGYYSSNNKFCSLDTESQWNWYKDVAGDVYSKFFKYNPSEFQTEVKNFTESQDEDQFSDYSLINYDFVFPFVEKYFSPSDEVIKIQENLVNKYNIDFDKTICVCYRGNDKTKETNLPTYQEMENKVLELTKLYPEHKILIQSDENEFYNFFSKEYNNLIIIDEILKMDSNPWNAIQYTVPTGSKVTNAQTFLAIMLIMSKCDSIVINSGNIGLWTCLYRGNNKKVHQFLHPKNSTEKNWYTS